MAVRFSIDRSATWELGYRPSGSSGAFSAFPAGQASLDPKREMRKERAARLITGYQGQGQEPSEALLRAAREG